MAKRITYNIITGNDPRLRMCFYYSPYFDQNIWRRGTSLTGERTKKDPAFKGFRQSSSRLKEASPIAASLYKLVPEAVKQYPLYRTLTGEAIKMLKEGIEVVVIKETLKIKYIDPLLGESENNSDNIPENEPAAAGRVKGMAGFTAYPKERVGAKKNTRRHRSLLLQQNLAAQSAAEYFSTTDSHSLSQTRINISESPISEKESPEEPKQRAKTTSGLIYLGRLPACKKLKIWVRSSTTERKGVL
jgi:hypothetical protein